MPDLTEELSKAAVGGKVDEIRRLLSQGVDVNAKTREGSTALHAAMLSEKAAVVELLLASGVNVNALNRYGETPLERAVYYVREYDTKEIVELLRRRGGILKGTYANYGEYESYRRPK